MKGLIGTSRAFLDVIYCEQLTAAQAANVLLVKRTANKSSLGMYFAIIPEISAGMQEIGEAAMPVMVTGDRVNYFANFLMDWSRWTDFTSLYICNFECSKE